MDAVIPPPTPTLNFIMVGIIIKGENNDREETWKHPNDSNSRPPET